MAVDGKAVFTERGLPIGGNDFTISVGGTPNQMTTVAIAPKSGEGLWLIMAGGSGEAAKLRVISYSSKLRSTKGNKRYFSPVPFPSLKLCEVFYLKKGEPGQFLSEPKLHRYSSSFVRLS
jgi:hypothetical protein